MAICGVSHTISVARSLDGLNAIGTAGHDLRDELGDLGIVTVGGDVFGNDVVEFGANRASAIDGHGSAKAFEVLVEGAPRHELAANALDLRAGGAEKLLAGRVEQFIELFAFTQAREANLDLIFALAGKLDQGAGELKNGDGLAHVEKQNIAVLADGVGLEYQGNGFTGGHEEALDVLVSDGERLIIAKLPLEHWNDATAGAEDVAEPN